MNRMLPPRAKQIPAKILTDEPILGKPSTHSWSIQAAWRRGVASLWNPLAAAMRLDRPAKRLGPASSVGFGVAAVLWSVFCGALVMAQNPTVPGTDDARLAEAASDVDGHEALELEQLTSPVQVSLRGLAVVSPQIVWASGADGTVLRTLDGGQHWDERRVPDESTKDRMDFRDIHAWDAESAIVVSAGNPAQFFRTEDGGQSWTLAFEKRQDGMFVDAMAFWNAKRGIAFGDPIDGRLFVAMTRDAGQSWSAATPDQSPVTLPGEAGFAGSGTCLEVTGERTVWIGLGGDTGQTARIGRSSDGGAHWTFCSTPMASSQSAGIFSLAFVDHQRGVAVGGDYLADQDRGSCACVTTDGGATWQLARQGPGGYRSCVATTHQAGKHLTVCTGTSGTDISFDAGDSWRPLSPLGFHVVAFSSDGSVGWLAGAQGAIARIRRRQR